MEKIENRQQEINNTSTIADTLSEYLRHWKWFIISIIICMVIAFFVIQKTQSEYKISLSVLLNEDKTSKSNTSSGLSLDELGLLSTTNNLDNEISILSSPDLMAQVADSLNLQTTYFIRKGLRKEEIYNQSPVIVKYEGNEERFPGIIEFFIQKIDNEFMLEGYLKQANGNQYKITRQIQAFPATITLPDSLGIIEIQRTEKNFTDNEKYHISIVSLPTIVGILCNGLTVSQTTKGASVLDLNLLIYNREKGAAILRELVRQYNAMNVQVNNEMALNTSLFINARLKDIAVELGDVEKEVVDYKQRNRIADLSAEAQLSIQQTGQNKDRLMEVETQLNVISMVERFVNNPNNKYKVIPNLGVSDPALSQIITEYNKKVLTSDALLKNTGEENPTRVRVTEEIDNMRAGISNSIRNVEQAYKISRQDLQRMSKGTQSHIQSIPQQEKGLLEKVRQQQIKENLFLFLMQKREETNMAIASTSDKARIIVSPEWKGSLVAPRSKNILLSAFLIGILLPITVIYIINLLNKNIRSRSDFEKLGRISVIGEIGRNKDKKAIVVQSDQSSGLSEMFRSLRNNLSFILKPEDKRIILVTSTIASEGKTFISANLSLSFALSGKKVLLVGCDIRNPKLRKYLNVDEKKGLVDFLIGDTSDNWKKYINNSTLNSNLDILFAGTIPPNPNELLLSSKLGLFFAQIKEEYDIIILDSAPVGLVSDSYLINQYTDVTVYVVRENLTPKTSVNFINLQKTGNKLNNMYLVYNDSQLDNSYRYGYGKKYGYNN